MSWLFWYCVISHCFFTIILYNLTENLLRPAKNAKPDCAKREQLQELSNVPESSIWCYGKHKSERICRFKNLYYSPSRGEYIFFHGKASVMQGVPEKRCEPALLDLSSVNDHNLQYFHFQDAPVSALNSFTDIITFDGPSLLFHRFNPENLMHVFHDDLLPMFDTMKQYFPDFEQNRPFEKDIQLVFMEGRPTGPFYELYKLFSKKLLRVSDLSLDNDNLVVCFRKVTVGISKSTTWYDFGFQTPQGPIPNHAADGLIIRQFTEYVAHELAIDGQTDKDYVILFSRETNRLILNELDLTFTIATTLNLRVVRLSLENNKLDEIIKQIKGAAGIIAMHGSILVLSMFLSPGSFLIELFPYAINAQHYTPYKTLAQILHLSYSSWQNKIKQNTVTYPNRTSSEGGIMHLDRETQTQILNTADIPRHLCCTNPYWLFRIYQDTIVDIPSFVQVMKDVQNQSKVVYETDLIKKYPGKIKSVFCKNLESKTGAAIFVSWRPSWNMQFYYSTEVSYEVWIQHEENYMAYSLQVTEHTFAENIEYNTSYTIWVRGVLKSNTGPFSNACACLT